MRYGSFDGPSPEQLGSLRAAIGDTLQRTVADSAKQIAAAYEELRDMTARVAALELDDAEEIARDLRYEGYDAATVTDETIFRVAGVEGTF